MKKLTLLLSYLIAISYVSNAQTRAVTEEGDTIYVYDNGTWTYELLDEMPSVLNELSYLEQELKIDTIYDAFSTPKTSNKTLKNSRNQFIVKYDDSIWKRVPPATLNDDAEFALQGKNTDVWCIIISEETPIESDKLFKIAKHNMKENTGADADILITELRTVNNAPVIRGTLKASFSGIDFIFDSYYFSNESGSVQFTTWTSDQLWKKNEGLILDLLNGFEIIE